MRDPLLAAGLLCTGTGLMLGVGKTPANGAAVLFGAAIVAAMAAPTPIQPRVPPDGAFLAAWLGIAVCAALALLGEHIPRVVALPVAAMAGGATGLLAVDWRTLIALVVAPIAIAATRRVARTQLLIPRVVAGWLLAVAVLNASLAMLPVTPGYLPDHLE